MDIFKRNKNKRFWEWFTQNSDIYFSVEDNQDALFDELHERLQKISKFACFEFGPEEKGKREFIISADGVAAGARAVQDLVAAAPKLNKWKIIAFRPRVGAVKIEMDGRVLNANDMAYRYAFNEDNRIDLQLYIKGYSQDHQREYMGAAFVLLDALIGEYDAMTKIGVVEFCNLKAGSKKELHSFNSLPELVDSRRSNPVL